MQEANEMRDLLIREFSKNYMEKLFYFCLKKTGCIDEAEDLAQDIALQIIAALNKETIPVNFSAWVWQIARNRYSVWAKQKHNRNESVTGSDISDYEIEDESGNSLDEMIHTEQMALLRRELAFIKSDYRGVVVAYYIDDKSVREIASALSLSVNTVKSRLLRARQILKEGMNMARNFGKRSYDPEEIVYSNICIKPGEFGQPWTLMDSRLNQNVLLACYDNPMTMVDLAIEVGVALPYMEDTVRHLTAQTLLFSNGDKYETKFPIISQDALRKIHFYYEGIMPGLIADLTENIDRLMLQCEEAELCYFGEYQSYEEAKWVLLMNFYKVYYALCHNSPTVKLGSTRRTDGGIWDVVGFEKCDFTPGSVGFHCQSNGFIQYRFGYAGIQYRTPANLTKEETHELLLMVEHKEAENPLAAEKLVQYGYACKNENRYIPRVTVISKSVDKALQDFYEQKKFSEVFAEHLAIRNKLHGAILETIEKINDTLRDILNEDFPKSIRNNVETVDALLETIGTGHTLGYIVKHALDSGWLKYDENTSPAIGAYFNMP